VTKALGDLLRNKTRYFTNHNQQLQMHATKNSLIHQEKEDARMQSEKRRRQSKE
jgi:hypothetical protein